MTDELYDAFEAEEQAGWDRRRAIFLKAVAQARNEALEEAAMVAETTVPPFIASAIRALITTRQGE